MHIFKVIQKQLNRLFLFVFLYLKSVTMDCFKISKKQLAGFQVW